MEPVVHLDACSHTTEMVVSFIVIAQWNTATLCQDVQVHILMMVMLCVFLQ